MNEVNVSREQVLQGFGAIGADHGIDINQFLDEQEQIDVQRDQHIEAEMPATQEILQEVGKQFFQEHAPGLNLQDAEVDRLARVWGPVIDKYFPGGLLAFLHAYRLEIAAVSTTYIVFAPRYRAYKKHLAEQDQATPATTDNSRETQGQPANHHEDLDDAHAA